jgi:glycosyltransferase involved in cell wall biosynthesis
MNTSGDTSDWKFAIEIFPPDWQCPAAPFWVAGWIDGGTETVADARAALDGRLFLGLCALPRPEIEVQRRGQPGAPFLGFSFLLEPFAGARELTIEVCDRSGRWHLLHRQNVTVDPAAPPRSPPPMLSEMWASLVVSTLLERKKFPARTWADCADAAFASQIAKPLDTLPNPPFYGRLEEPTSLGRIKYGRLAITGWLAHRERPIRRLVAVVDPRHPTPLLHGLPRRDMTGLFADLANAERSQFIGHVDIPTALPHPVALRIFAEIEEGKLELVFTQRFRPEVVTGSLATFPPYSFESLLHAALGVWRSGTMRGARLGNWKEVIAGTVTARATYKAEAPSARITAANLSPVSAAKNPRPLSVAVVTHNLNFEGAPLFAFEYARYLATLPGWSVCIVSPQEGPLRAAFEGLGLKVHVVDARPLLDAKTSEEFETAVAALAQDAAWKGRDAIVTNTMVSFWAVHVARAARKPVLLYIHESASVRRFFSQTLAPALLPEVEAAFGRADRTVFIASASLAVHARHERKGNYRRLPSWIDFTRLEHFARQHPRAQLRAKYAFPDDAIVVINVGSVCERKGQHVFLRAIEHLRTLRGVNPEWSRIHFLMVGGRAGPYLDSLHHEIGLFGLSNVRVVDEVSDALPFYGMADLFVCSSFEESFPRVLMEAAAFKLPIVSTNVDGVTEMLTAEDAWLVAPGDAAQMGTAMNAALAAVLGGDRSKADRAHQAVRSRFDAAQVLPMHAALLTSTVEAYQNG